MTSGMTAYLVAVGELLPAEQRASVIQLKDACLDSFQYFPGISLELLEIAAFPFASRRALKYR